MASKCRRFYVYVLLDTRKPGEYIYGKYTFNYEPFYVGKGTGYRLYTHLVKNDREENKFKTSIIKKIRSSGNEPEYTKIEENLLEDKSLKLESAIIKAIGRRDLKLGPLVNLTDGGEKGNSGRVETIISSVKKSKATKGKIVSDFTKNKLKGPSRGVVYEITFPDGAIVRTSDLKGLRDKNNLTVSGVSKVVTGYQTHHHGFKIVCVNPKKSKRYKGCYRLVDPSGRTYTTNSLIKFSKDFKLNKSSLFQAAAGAIKYHFGWEAKRIGMVSIDTLTNPYPDYKPTKNYYYITSPTGEKYEVKNLIEFCKEHNLRKGTVFEMCRTGYKSRTGWAGYKEKKPNLA